MLEKLRALFTAAPKNLDEARSTYTEAKTTLDSVSALFAAAGLNLEQMLAAGPDALKAHLASIDNSAEVTRLGAELSTAKADLVKANEGLAFANSVVKGHEELFASIGVSFAGNASPDPKVFKAAFAAHVEKAATLQLASTGHPPAHIPAATETPAPAKSGAELLAEYSALKAGPEKQAFYARHEAALWDAARA